MGKMNSARPAPILRQKKSASSSKRLSVTFSKEVGIVSSSDEESTSSATTSISSIDLTAGLCMSDYGLCYEPPAPSLPRLSQLHPSVKIIPMKDCQRPELANAATDNNVLMLGDVIHGKCLMEELENSTLGRICVTISAVPTPELVRRCSFILILLPLEVVGSCPKVSAILRQLSAMRADFMLHCALVAVTTSHGRDQHVTDLYNLHTLLLHHKLSYYFWSDVAPGSWPGIIERLVIEVNSCQSAGSGTARGSGISRAVLSSLLWARQDSSMFMQEYLDVTLHRSSQHVDD